MRSEKEKTSEPNEQESAASDVESSGLGSVNIGGAAVGTEGPGSDDRFLTNRTPGAERDEGSEPVMTPPEPAPSAAVTIPGEREGEPPSGEVVDTGYEGGSAGGADELEEMGELGPGGQSQSGGAEGATVGRREESEEYVNQPGLSSPKVGAPGPERVPHRSERKDESDS